MTHSAGIRLGPYEILAPLGEGGMGEFRGHELTFRSSILHNGGVLEELWLLSM